MPASSKFRADEFFFLLGKYGKLLNCKATVNNESQPVDASTCGKLTEAEDETETCFPPLTRNPNFAKSPNVCGFPLSHLASVR
ncbi:hypothetical protein CDAR_218041 [Caerostris darwini]|uniref:Uncharacterized protein n=1 Tax=Caerostris darwini TaxID=1538125 RepID=A0AAV4TGA4_9ARAC|nr:hypothetical protein CDAR_218041 [Caerostris darwini]